jgi:hypothetical protein
VKWFGYSDQVLVHVCDLGDLVVLGDEFNVPRHIKGYETLHLQNIMRFGNVTKIVIGW